MKILLKALSRFTILGLVSLSLFVVSTALSPGHSSAATPINPGYNPNNCVKSTTEFNVVVYVRIEDYLGNTKGYSDGFTFTVDPHFTGSNTSAWNDRKKTAIRNWNSGKLENLGSGAHDFTVAMNGNGSMPERNGNICADTAAAPGTRMPAYAFRDGDWTCHPSFTDSYSSRYPLNTPTAVPDQSVCYPYRGDNTTGANGNNKSRSLSCLELPGTAFTFTLNTGAVSGYYVTDADHWTTRQIYAPGGTWLNTSIDFHYDGSGLLNNTSQMVEFVYREPPPTPPTMSPTGSVTNVSNSNANAAGYIEPGSSFTAAGDISASSSTNGGSVNATWHLWYDTDQNYATSTPVTNPPLLKNQTVNLTFGAAGGTQNIGSLGPTPISNVIADTYNFICSEVIINSVSGSPTPNISANRSKRCLSIERRPYFQVQGGDANAAASLMSGSSCSAANGKIAAYNDGINGAGTNIAAFASSAITEFSSGGTPRPYGLTFINIPVTAWGGGFDQTYCISDTEFSGTNVGSYLPPSLSPVTITGYETHYMTGDVYINNNINYPANFNMDGNMPFYKIATTGNIYIRKNVTQLNGLYEAKGTIFTCAEDDLTSPGMLRAPSLAEIKTDCQPTLTITGALVASTIKLLRSSGSVSNPLPAEKIIFSPEVWLRTLNPNSGSNSSLGPIESITSLPPVL